MSSANQLPARSTGIVVLCIAAIAGIAVGWGVGPSEANALGYVYSVAGPACYGAMWVSIIRRGGRAARWLPLMLLAMFLLDIAKSPHVPSLSALGLAAVAIVGIATLCGHQRAAIISTVVSSALLAATLLGGRLRP